MIRIPLDDELTLAEFDDAVYLLKRHKSPGFDQILNEDIILTTVEESEEAPDLNSNNIELLKFIYRILTDFWFNECVPRDFKRTILRPFLKDNDKLSSDPSNYRPISLLNTLMKLYEGVICKRLTSFLTRNGVLSPNQAAYQANRSTSDHIFVIHELFLEYRFNKKGPRGGVIKKVLFFCFMDLRKAFDTVPLEILFAKLRGVGVRGKMLRVIMNLFSSNPANVLVGGYLSPEFSINRGVLQGSKLGPVLFNVFINDLLGDLNETGLGATIGPIHIPVLGFADDIVLISDNPGSLQRLIDHCHQWSVRNGMTFNTSKCKIMVFNGPPDGFRFTLDNEELEIVDRYKYLGVTLTSRYVTNLFRTHFARILDKARAKAAAIRRHGYHEDGLGLKAAIRLYRLVVRPTLDYCAQSLSYARYSRPLRPDTLGSFADELERFQMQTLKALVNCPRSASPAVVRLFCGVEPLSSRLEVMKLRYYWRLFHRPPDAITKRLLT